MFNNINLINECNNYFREVINYTMMNDGKDFNKQLSFLNLNKNSHKSICSSLDVICDTEAAKSNYYKYGLSGPTKIVDKGEEFLRLYGILSAVYLQINSITELLEVSKFDKKKDVISNFRNLDIYFLRNALASHTTNLMDENGHKTSIQYNVHDMDTEIEINFKGSFRKFILKNSILSFDNYFKDIYFKLINKYIKIIYKDNIPKELNDKLIILENRMAGNLVIEIPGGDPLIIKFES